jgi:tetratricopeptide (TPR) repeat protein
LLSRIGQALTVVGRGNLAQAEHALRDALTSAEAFADREAQARAHHEIGVLLSIRGQAAEAIPHVWRAFELYDEEIARLRTLNDLGMMLLVLGDADGAERALSEVVRRAPTPEIADNAIIELMYCASYRRDRVGFERWREQCDARRDSMPPSVLADYMLKAGIGRARFGQLDRAERLMASALRIADDAGLHELTFRIERIKGGLRDCDCPEAAAESDFRSKDVREVSAALAHLQP